mmetsp:Transcript_59596/g.128998  ORF Transcript_59596/g.128998 Transcript_59596/m.128998 type:complete len:250 (-) Transcript_59596:56-805(-)
MRWVLVCAHRLALFRPEFLHHQPGLRSCAERSGAAGAAARPCQPGVGPAHLDGIACVGGGCMGRGPRRFLCRRGSSLGLRAAYHLLREFHCPWRAGWQPLCLRQHSGGHWSATKPPCDGASVGRRLARLPPRISVGLCGRRIECMGSVEPHEGFHRRLCLHWARQWAAAVLARRAGGPSCTAPAHFSVEGATLHRCRPALPTAPCAAAANSSLQSKRRRRRAGRGDRRCEGPDAGQFAIRWWRDAQPEW